MTSQHDNGRYRYLAPLGAGGMATVTLAEDTMLGRRVALKRVHAASDPRGLTRLRREALVGASLNHPNLVSVFDVQAEGDGDLVIVMQYVAGDTLRDLVRSRGALPAREALRILEGVAAGLDAIHERGIVHRDVKPANILLGTDGVVKLADLGIAAVADRTQITTAGAVVGTFSYMAPEQLEGRSSDRAMDIYALAAVAFEVLSGQKARPESNPLALAHAISTRPPPNLCDEWPQAPAAAAAVLQRGMAADPTQRPRTAGELVGRLRAALEDPHTTQAAVAPIAPRRPSAPMPVVAPAAAEPAQDLPAAGAMPAGRPAPRSRPVVVPAQRAPRPAPKTAGASRVPLAVQGRPTGRPGRPTGPGERPVTRMAPVLALLAALIGVGVLVLLLTSSNGTRGSKSAAASAGSGHRAATGGQARTTPNSATKPAGGGPLSTPSKTGSGSSAAAALPASATAPPTGAASAATPSGAVQAFYAAAARHDYATAWQLADTSMRNEVGGFASFQAQQSAVRSITFHQAQTQAGGDPSSATVAVRTTSVLVNKTQQCAGTARTVRTPGGTWMLDGISINCTPP